MRYTFFISPHEKLITVTGAVIIIVFAKGEREKKNISFHKVL